MGELIRFATILLLSVGCGVGSVPPTSGCTERADPALCAHLVPDDVELSDPPPRAGEAVEVALRAFERHVGPMPDDHPGVVHLWTHDSVADANRRHITGLHWKHGILLEHAPTFRESALAEEVGHYVHEYALGDADGSHTDEWFWTDVVPAVDHEIGRWES